ncbi:MAG: helix-turn-helix transcriptional regulator [Rhodoferax sp.]|nr:helix-turn-helix transcriptional regulator [Rhodoferax sp.]
MTAVTAAPTELPSRSDGQIERHAVCERLCTSAARLLLLHAPAGFGKTTTMLQCRERFEVRGIATAWITLDGADNDIARFLARLEAVVAGLGIVPGQPGSPHDLVPAFAARAAPFAVFLDDFEALQEPTVLELVQEILEHLPRHGRLVIGSRSTPALNLGRLRVRRQVDEVGAPELRFDPGETATFLARRGCAAMDAGQVTRLHAKTEGWCAALWLASIALQRSADPAAFVARFSGSDRAVADYLAEDVLAQQSPQVREFLLATSILRQLEPALCQALCPQLDCTGLLAQLERENLFLMPVAALPGAWRYHSLFADFLRARLRAEQPDSLGRLHGAASQWYEGCGRPVPATDHALEAADWPRVLDLLAQHAERLLEQGRMRLLARWFAGIPASLLRAHPHVQMMGIWATLFTRGPWEALRQVEASACVRSDDARVQQNLAAMRPLALAMQDRYPEAYVAGVASLEAAPVEATFAHGVLHNAMANIFSVLGNAREAQRLLDGARAARGEDTFNRMYTESMEGMLDLLAGRLRHAKARFRMAVDATHAANFNQTHGNAWAGVLYACVAYESNQLERAGHLLNVYLPMAREVGLPDHMILSHVMRARIASVEGDGDAALSTLAELEDIGYARKLPRVAVAARLERARLLMLQDDGPAALRELERADIAEIWAREREQRLLAHDLDTLVLAQLRHALEFGDPASCIAPLTRELEAARLGGRGRRVLRIQLLRAMALQAAGRTPRALQDMAPVLQTAAQEGYMRMLLDEGPAALALLRLHAQTQQGQRLQPLLADHVDRLLRCAAQAPAGPPPPVAAPSEALTGKELQVLVLLGQGYSNSALAGRLQISDSTVRTHLRNIYQKLGASSRTHAVAVARERRMIA